MTGKVQAMQHQDRRQEQQKHLDVKIAGGSSHCGSRLKSFLPSCALSQCLVVPVVSSQPCVVGVAVVFIAAVFVEISSNQWWLLIARK